MLTYLCKSTSVHAYMQAIYIILYNVRTTPYMYTTIRM